jgi:hypothetical protein
MSFHVIYAYLFKSTMYLPGGILYANENKVPRAVIFVTNVAILIFILVWF